VLVWPNQTLGGKIIGPKGLLAHLGYWGSLAKGKEGGLANWKRAYNQTKEFGWD